MTFFAHPSAVVDDGASIGEGCHIWHFCHISAGAVIGADCSFGQNVFISNNVKIGRRVKVQNNVSIYDNVSLEDDVFCGPSMVFTNVHNPRAHFSRKNEYRDTIIRRGATLGANCTIVCGVEIGEFAFIGAGAVVCKPVPPYALMVGVPARHIGWMSAAGCRLDLPTSGEAMAQCRDTGAEYRLSGGIVEEIGVK